MLVSKLFNNISCCNLFNSLLINMIYCALIIVSKLYFNVAVIIDNKLPFYFYEHQQGGRSCNYVGSNHCFNCL